MEPLIYRAYQESYDRKSRGTAPWAFDQGYSCPMTHQEWTIRLVPNTGYNDNARKREFEWRRATIHLDLCGRWLAGR